MNRAHLGLGCLARATSARVTEGHVGIRHLRDRVSASDTVHIFDLVTYYPVCAETEDDKRRFDRDGFMCDNSAANCEACLKKR